MMKRNGFILLEVLTTLAISSVLVAGGLALSNYLAKTAQYSERKAAISSLERMIGERLKDPALCLQTLGSGSGLNNSVSTAGSSNGAAQVRLNLPNIQAGPDYSSNVLGADVQILPLKIQIKKIELKDTLPITATKYQSNIYLQIQDGTNFSYKENLLAGLVLTVNGGAIVGCHANTLQDSQEVCQDMGCTYNAAATPNCQCASATPIPCPANQYPVTYSSSGTPTCVPLGGTCPSGQYLQGVHLNGVTCSAPNPAPVPIPGACGGANLHSYASAAAATAAGLCGTGPLSAAISGSGPWSWSCLGASGGAAANCSASQTAPSTTCPAGTSATGTGGPATPGCYCVTASQSWDGSSCVDVLGVCEMAGGSGSSGSGVHHAAARGCLANQSQCPNLCKIASGPITAGTCPINTHGLYNEQSWFQVPASKVAAFEAENSAVPACILGSPGFNSGFHSMGYSWDL